MPVSSKHRPPSCPVSLPVPLPLPTDVQEVAAPPNPPAYRGDYYGLMVWFGGGIILVILHILDATSRWFNN